MKNRREKHQKQQRRRRRRQEHRVIKDEIAWHRLNCRTGKTALLHSICMLCELLLRQRIHRRQGDRYNEMPWSKRANTCRIRLFICLSVYVCGVCRWENVSLCFSSPHSMSRECIVYKSWRIPCCYHSDYDESFEIKSIRLVRYCHTLTHTHSRTFERLACMYFDDIGTYVCAYYTAMLVYQPYVRRTHHTAHTHLISIDQMFSICHYLNSTEPFLCVLCRRAAIFVAWKPFTFAMLMLNACECHIVSNALTHIREWASWLAGWR